MFESTNAYATRNKYIGFRISNVSMGVSEKHMVCFVVRKKNPLGTAATLNKKALMSRSRCWYKSYEKPHLGKMTVLACLLYSSIFFHFNHLHFIATTHCKCTAHHFIHIVQSKDEQDDKKKNCSTNVNVPLLVRAINMVCFIVISRIFGAMAMLFHLLCRCHCFLPLSVNNDIILT